MNYLFFGLIFCGIFGIGFLGVLQYIFLVWQNNRLRGERVVKELPKMPKFSEIRLELSFKIAQNWSKIIANLTGRNRPQKLSDFVLTTEKIRKNIFQKLQKLFDYLQSLGKVKKISAEFEDNFDQNIKKINTDLDDIHLTQINYSKNINTQKHTHENSYFDKINDDLDNNLGENLEDNWNQKTKNEDREIAFSKNLTDYSSQKLDLENLDFQKTSPTLKKEPESKISFSQKTKTDDIWDNLNWKKTNELEGNFAQADKVDLNQNTATIGLIITPTQKDEDLSLFEKAEKKLIQKLQDLGLNHWDLWLDLGDLYGKYDQKSKQKEIYTLILSKADGKEKELATYRLIGMN